MIEPFFEEIKVVLVALLGTATLIQISPLKIDPWSWLGRAIGRAINGEVLEKMRDIEQRMDKMEAKDEEREAKNARVRILRFGDEILSGKEHSKEHSDQILDDIDQYEDYCRTHPDFKNNRAVLTMQLIKERYMTYWDTEAKG